MPGDPGHRYNGQTTKHDTPSLTPPPILTPFRTQDFTLQQIKTLKATRISVYNKMEMCAWQLTRLPIVWWLKPHNELRCLTKLQCSKAYTTKLGSHRLKPCLFSHHFVKRNDQKKMTRKLFLRPGTDGQNKVFEVNTVIECVALGSLVKQLILLSNLTSWMHSRQFFCSPIGVAFWDQKSYCPYRKKLLYLCGKLSP